MQYLYCMFADGCCLQPCDSVFNSTLFAFVYLLASWCDLVLYYFNANGTTRNKLTDFTDSRLHITTGLYYRFRWCPDCIVNTIISFFLILPGSRCDVIVRCRLPRRSRPCSILYLYKNNCNWRDGHVSAPSSVCQRARDHAQ